MYIPRKTKTLFRLILQKEHKIRSVYTFARRCFKDGLPKTIEKIKQTAAIMIEQDSNTYNYWLRNIHQPTIKERKAMKIWATNIKDAPKISILLPVYNSNPKWLHEAINSVINQIYPHWELCIADDASTDPKIKSILEAFSSKDKRIKVVYRSENGHISKCSNSAISIATGEWFGLLDHDDLLSVDALIWVAKVIIESPRIKLIYSDEDQFHNNKKHCNPYFKSDWDPILAEGQNLFSHLGIYNAELVRSLEGFRIGFEGSQDYDLILRCSERVERCQIYHIPRILYHMRIHKDSSSMGAKGYAQFAAERALGDHLRRIKISGRVIAMKFGYRIINTSVISQLVSIIIPTKDKLDLLTPCIESILATTNYRNFEIILLNNGSVERNCVAYLEKLRLNQQITVVDCPEIFNYSALINKGAKHAKGEFILLMNNDVVVLHQDWLEELLGLALRPGIGAVGAKLLYPNGKVQHAGIILGIGGVAGHAHLGIDEHKRGYFSRAVLVQEMSAVTAAVLLVQKQLFFEVGGFNEINLPIAFNDVDFCLKLINAGYKNIFTPFARLIHHESATRGSDETPENAIRYKNEERWMQNQWGDLLHNDPSYNPNLSLESHNFEISPKPRLLRFQKELGE